MGERLGIFGCKRGRKCARQQGRTFLYKNDADFRIWISREKWQAGRREVRRDGVCASGQLGLGINMKEAADRCGLALAVMTGDEDVANWHFQPHSLRPMTTE